MYSEKLLKCSELIVEMMNCPISARHYISNKLSEKAQLVRLTRSKLVLMGEMMLLLTVPWSWTGLELPAMPHLASLRRILKRPLSTPSKSCSMASKCGRVTGVSGPATSRVLLSTMAMCSNTCNICTGEVSVSSMSCRRAEVPWALELIKMQTILVSVISSMKLSPTMKLGNSVTGRIRERTVKSSVSFSRALDLLFTEAASNRF